MCFRTRIGLDKSEDGETMCAYHKEGEPHKGFFLHINNISMDWFPEGERQ